MTSWAEDRRTAGLDGGGRMSAVTDWRVELAAAREPLTEEQQAWDRRWRERYGRYVAGGRTPFEAITIADRLTKDQLGSRPEQGAQQT